MSGIIEQMQTEIEMLKSQVAELKTTIEKQTVNNHEQIIKSQQQHRDKIVEQAKRDVDYLKDADGLYTVESGSEFNYACYSEFFVNKEKRTVVALLRGFRTKRIRATGIAKCVPNDCFNSHIGKAIALRRALGLPVPDEYLNAPQPTEVRVGDIVKAYIIDGSIETKPVIAVHPEQGEQGMNVKLPGRIVRYPSNYVKIINDSRENITHLTKVKNEQK